MPALARSHVRVCLATALAWMLGVAHAQPAAAPAPVWIEQSGLLAASRLWIAPEQADALRSLPVETLELRVDWVAPADREDGTTQAERESLLDATARALMAPAPGTAPMPLPMPASAEPGVRYRIEARITEVWRPHRLVNVVLAAMPWPLAPLFSQGGAATEVRLVDTADDTRPLARFECRRHAGVLQFYNAFWRIEHTRAALTGCARDFRIALHAPAAAPGPPAREARRDLTTLAASGNSPN
jgi:hypothetical protein